MLPKLKLHPIHYSLLTNTGWKHKVELHEGVKTMYEWYVGNIC